MPYLRVYALPILLLALAVALLWQFVEPAPPDRIRLATGPEGGFYERLGEAFQRAFAEEGVALELVPTRGSVENLAFLEREEDGVDAAFVQGGIAAGPAAALVSLGSLAIEPLWVFTSKDRPVRDLGDLAQGRIAAGPEGSGTRRLVETLFERLGVAEVEMVPLGGVEAAEALLEGEVEAALFVTTPVSRALTILRDAAPSVRLAGLERAPALARNFAYLTELRLPEAALDLAGGVPERPLDLIGVATNLVARESLHPAIAGLFVQTAHEIATGNRLLGTWGLFPNVLYVERPLHVEAERYFTQGPSLLQRYFPFWAANLVDRLWVLAIPILTLAFPLFRIAPPAYQWQMSRRIWRWYKDLRSLEERGETAADAAERRAILADLAGLEAEVERIKVPLAYAERLYHLRQHIEFVRSRVADPLASGLGGESGGNLQGRRPDWAADPPSKRA